MDRIGVAVIGGGQAGLALSHELTVRGVEHVVLERGRIGQTWRDRWDSFCLVTPNWSIRLPGGEYVGDDPDGYLPRDEIVRHLERYAESFGAPVREGVEVRSIEGLGAGGFRLATSAGDLQAEQLVIANGAYQRPHRPPGAAALPASLLQIDVGGYRNPDALPPGGVLVVGSGQSGCQLAEELHEAGRRVVLSCGRTPWAPRRVAGRDIVWWIAEIGFLDATVESLPDPSARLVSNVVTTGHGGGHDLHLRTLRALGVQLVGHLVGAAGGDALFAPDLGPMVAWGDARWAEIVPKIEAFAVERGLGPLDLVPPAPFDPSSADHVPLDGIGCVIFAGGFRPDYRSWLPWPEAFDDLGFPIHHEGASTVVDGLSFVGVHFLRKRKSSIFYGVGEDATIVATTIAARQTA